MMVCFPSGDFAEVGAGDVVFVVLKDGRRMLGHVKLFFSTWWAESQGYGFISFFHRDPGMSEYSRDIDQGFFKEVDVWKKLANMTLTEWETFCIAYRNLLLINKAEKLFLAKVSE